MTCLPLPEGWVGMPFYWLMISWIILFIVGGIVTLSFFIEPKGRKIKSPGLKQ